jgi:hypothetical protein
MIRWACHKLQVKLERYCSRKVGNWAVYERQRGTEFPSSIWFKIASRIEFRLRWVYGPPLDHYQYRIKRMPKYRGGS